MINKIFITDYIVKADIEEKILRKSLSKKKK